MKADIAALTRSVEGLTSELAQLRDTVDTIERANKVINLRGAS